MSHFKERKEKNCLNCNATVYGRYCHICGQENTEPRETFWHLVTHFVSDVTHFDGKFFSSVKYLLFKPGFLSREYIRGKRMSYLNPIRMYLFISAFFFLFFFTFIKPHVDESELDRPDTSQEVRAKIQDRINDLQKELIKNENPETTKRVMKGRLAGLQQDLVTLQKDTNNLAGLNYYKGESITFNGINYRDLKGYDSIQSRLPASKRDSWLNRIVQKKRIDLSTKYNNNAKGFLDKLLEKFYHFFPQVFFVSLPFFALILKLIYQRSKNFYYTEHIIYTVHLYCATFIFMFFIFSLSKLEDVSQWHWLTYLTALLTIYIIWYQYKALRNFYNQGSSNTLLKFVLIAIMSSILMVVLFAAFFVFSLFTI